jgi:hypothetical protein
VYLLGAADRRQAVDLIEEDHRRLIAPGLLEQKPAPRSAPLRHVFRKGIGAWTTYRSCLSASPTHLLRQSAPLRIKKATCFPVCPGRRGSGTPEHNGHLASRSSTLEHVEARARAMRVFPVPGGP